MLLRTCHQKHLDPNLLSLHYQRYLLFERLTVDNSCCRIMFFEVAEFQISIDTKSFPLFDPNQNQYHPLSMVLTIMCVRPQKHRRLWHLIQNLP